MKILTLGLAVLTILVVTALLPIAIAQEVPAHVVISEGSFMMNQVRTITGTGTYVDGVSCGTGAATHILKGCNN